jgi:leucyl aminopeptidase
VLRGLPNIKANVVLAMGLGDPEKADPALSFRVAGVASQYLAKKPRRHIGYFLEIDSMSDAVCGSMVGCVGQDLYRAEKKLNPPGKITWWAKDDETIRQGEILGNSVNLTRRLVNEPANEIYPETLADQCRAVGASANFEVEIWNQERLQQEKCGALLAVAQGSDKEARLVIMNYQGGPKGQLPLTLVGKGVTFDSGGLSLKPSDAMFDMKCDMTGAATVIGAMDAIARLKLPVNVRGIIGCVENMVSGRCYKLGDVLTARNGKTIEIHNTDAEGRLVLADALCVAIDQGAGKLLDLATLTGACMVALGRDVAGIMANEQAWCDEVMAAANASGEEIWQLPMFDEYSEQIKSNVADIKNVGDGRWGGAITAAKFLEEFVGDVQWAHIDIAGPSFGEKPRDWIDGGASGCFVRTLVNLAGKYRG